jgi:hypothetical protein
VTPDLAVPTQRSAYAFALELCGAIFTTSIPAVLRDRPGTAGAVEAVTLVDQCQAAERPARTHLRGGMEQGRQNGRDARSVFYRRSDDELLVPDIFQRPSACHVSLSTRS